MCLVWGAQPEDVALWKAGPAVKTQHRSRCRYLIGSLCWKQRSVYSVPAASQSVRECGDTFFLTINEFSWLEANVYQHSTHCIEKRSCQNKFLPSTSHHTVCRRILLVSHVICLDVCVILLLLWWPGHALTMAEGWLTLRHTNLCGGMRLMIWRISYGELAGW